MDGGKCGSGGCDTYGVENCPGGVGCEAKDGKCAIQMCEVTGQGCDTYTPYCCAKQTLIDAGCGLDHIGSTWDKKCGVKCANDGGACNLYATRCCGIDEKCGLGTNQISDGWGERNKQCDSPACPDWSAVTKPDPVCEDLDIRCCGDLSGGTAKCGPGMSEATREKCGPMCKTSGDCTVHDEPAAR